MSKKLNIKNALALLAVLLIWGYVIKSKLGWFGDDDSNNTISADFAMAPVKMYAKD